MFDDVPTYPLDRPAVRPLEVIPIRAQEQNMLMVRDPLGLIEGVALLPPDPMLLMFLQMADGKTTTGEMAHRVTQLSGQIIPAGMFDSMVQQLDEALLLQSERFVEALRKKYEDFMASPTRPYRVFRMDGQDRLAMMKELGDEFRRHRMSSLSPPERLDLPARSVQAILSPHIDYQRGGEVYAWAYKALKEHGTGARTLVVLGTSHRPTSHRFVATAKDYDTPLGTVGTDKELLEELREAFDGELWQDEYIHADEHAIELQAMYLKHMFGDECPRIVPILVGSFDDYLEDGTGPKDDEEIQAFIKALRSVLDKHGNAVGVIGGVDFSHCGPEFGHEELNEDERVKEIEDSDRAVLDAIEAGDPDAFFDVFRKDGNGTNVCSIAPIYCVMAAMRDRAKARVLKYNKDNSPDKTCLVSFASVAYLDKDVADTGGGAPKIILVSR